MWRCDVARIMRRWGRLLSSRFAVLEVLVGSAEGVSICQSFCSRVVDGRDARKEDARLHAIWEGLGLGCRDVRVGVEVMGSWCIEDSCWNCCRRHHVAGCVEQPTPPLARREEREDWAQVDTLIFIRTILTRAGGKEGLSANSSLITEA